MLLNLLAQNPAISVTPTNDLAELVLQMRDLWQQQVGFKAQGLWSLKPRILGMLRGMVEGFHAAELSAGKTVIDKSRAWLGQIALLEEVLHEQVKIIVPVRPVEDILASFEKIHRKSALVALPYQGPLYALRQSVVGRCQSHLAPEATLGITIARLRDALACGFSDRLLFVPYRSFTAHPNQAADWLTAELYLPAFDYDPSNVCQVTREDDSVYGMPLHNIREGVIEAKKGCAWEGILEDSFVQWVEKEYADINELAYMRPAWKSCNMRSAITQIA